MIDYGHPISSSGLDPQPAPSPWRDFSEEEQRLMRNLLRRMKDLKGKRFEVSMLKDGRLEIVEVDRRVIAGRGVLNSP